MDDFKYLGSTVQSNGECGREVKKRVQAGWNGWRRMSGVICDRRVPARVKGKVYRVEVRPAMLYGLETVALTKRQEAEMEVAELNMLRFSLGVTRMDKIRNHHHHIVSATALIHRTARPSISAMSSLLGISPKCVQLVMIMVKIACGCAAHTVFVLTVAPQMFRCRGGSLSRAHSVGRPPCTWPAVLVQAI